MLPEEVNRRAAPKPGFVYLMVDSRGRYKIGHSVNPGRRRAGLSSADNLVKIVLLVATLDMIGLELRLQIRYKDRHMSHEWYRLTRKDVEEIKRMPYVTLYPLPAP